MSWSKCNRQKKRQLGMNPSTATARLKREILYSLVKETGKDTCFHCKKKIKKAEDLSIAHKKPWLHVNADLFWDLDNIAFAHKKCNTPDRPKSWGRDR